MLNFQKCSKHIPLGKTLIRKLNRTGPKKILFTTSLLYISCELLTTALNIFKKLQAVKKADNSFTWPSIFLLHASLLPVKIHSVLLIILLHFKCMGGETIFTSIIKLQWLKTPDSIDFGKLWGYWKQAEE